MQSCISCRQDTGPEPLVLTAPHAVCCRRHAKADACLSCAWRSCRAGCSGMGALRCPWGAATSRSPEEWGRRDWFLEFHMLSSCQMQIVRVSALQSVHTYADRTKQESASAQLWGFQGFSFSVARAHLFSPCLFVSQPRDSAPEVLSLHISCEREQKRIERWEAEMIHTDLVVIICIDTSDFSYCIYKISC